MTAEALSRLTWDAYDRAAWLDAYRAALRIAAERNAATLARVDAVRARHGRPLTVSRVDVCQDRTCAGFGLALVDGLCPTIAGAHSVHADILAARQGAREIERAFEGTL